MYDISPVFLAQHFGEQQRTGAHLCGRLHCIAWRLLLIEATIDSARATHSNVHTFTLIDAS